MISDDSKDSIMYTNNDYYEHKFIKNKILKNVIIIIFIMSMATLIGLFFKVIDLNESSIILVFILGVLFSAIKTDGYIYGILSSIVGVLSFNFFFTEPYYTFIAYRADYPITFLIMLISAAITSTLTSKIKREIKLSNMREQRIKLLYKNNKNLLKAKNKDEIVEICNSSLVDILNRSVATAIVDNDENLKKIVVETFKDEDANGIFQSPLEKCALKECFSLGEEVGCGTEFYQNAKTFNFPIKGHKNVLGVIGISCIESVALTENEKILLKSVSNQVALAIEREDLFEKTRKANIDAETERLRSNLLRSISHDLRTPLTSIIGSSSTILENYDYVDEDIKKELLKNIYEDASWLARSVENIISITRVDEGRLEVKKNLEVVEEIVEESIFIVKKFSNKHNIIVDIPDNVIIINVDGLLIEQVIINLIDNAMRYTPDNSEIKVKVMKIENYVYFEVEVIVDIPDNVIIINVDGLLIEQVIINLIDNAMRYTPDNSEIKVKVMKIENYVYFEVEDNGYGLKDEDIDHIFDRFYSKTNRKSLEKRGIGLGLSICKSIIEAHDGEIEAFNNKLGGATFRFKIPCEEE